MRLSSCAELSLEPESAKRFREACPRVDDPVCGCDSVIYPTACHAAQPGVGVGPDLGCQAPNPKTCGAFTPNLANQAGTSSGPDDACMSSE
ncbi:MAG: hypothetical protein ACI9OJ_006085 [Myxococcota bacterium]|jgi:hypothetical protein